VNAKRFQQILIGVLSFVAVVSTVLLFQTRSAMSSKPECPACPEQAPAVQIPASRCDAGGPGANDALAVIHARTSVRAYKDQPVSLDQVEKMLKAGMAAPTAGNRQPWYFVATTDRAVMDKLAEANEHGAMLKSAGAAIVVVGSPPEGLRGESGEMWVQDCAAATQNILLAATAQGLGAVWIGIHPVTDRVAAVRNILEIPQDKTPFSIVSIGWPEGTPTPKDKFKPEKVFNGKWGTAFEFSKPAATPPDAIDAPAVQAPEPAPAADETGTVPVPPPDAAPAAEPAAVKPPAPVIPGLPADTMPRAAAEAAPEQPAPTQN